MPYSRSKQRRRPLARGNGKGTAEPAAECGAPPLIQSEGQNRFRSPARAPMPAPATIALFQAQLQAATIRKASSANKNQRLGGGARCRLQREAAYSMLQVFFLKVRASSGAGSLPAPSTEPPPPPLVGSEARASTCWIIRSNTSSMPSLVLADTS